MNRKIIVTAILLVIAVLVFASCNKKEKPNDNTTASQQSSQTNNFEYSTNDNGEVFITNVKGEEIPVTKSSDGSIELIDDLITKTAEQVSSEKAEIESNKTATSASSAASTASSTSSSSSSSGGIVIGSEDPLENEENAAVIDWR